LKILFIHSHYQLQGGEDTVVQQEVALLQKEHDVALLSFQNIGGLKGGIQFIKSIWNTAAAGQIEQKIKEFQPDVVHVHNWHFGIGPLAFRTVSKLGIPIVHTLHNYRLLCPSAILLHDNKLFTASLQSKFPWQAVFKKVYRNSFMLTLWLAFIVWFHKKIGTWQLIDTYVCLTPFAVNLFASSTFGIDKDQFVVKPNFTTRPILQEAIEREHHYLFIGRLSAEKGIVNLLEAFKELPYQLKIAGDGPLKELVIDTIKSNANISYLGSLKSSEVAVVLQKAKALLSPSICYEMFGLVNIEAFANHTAVIASNIGAPKSIIIEDYNGYLYEADNVNSLKEAIVKFESLSIQKMAQFRASAFNTYQTKYSPEMQLSYFEQIYSAAITSSLQVNA
jgi:glycosyltransferase involved in cell wall biosynthesis